MGARESRNSEEKSWRDSGEPLGRRLSPPVPKQLCECWLLIGQKNAFYYSPQSVDSEFACTKPTQRLVCSDVVHTASFTLRMCNWAAR